MYISDKNEEHDRIGKIKYVEARCDARAFCFVLFCFGHGGGSCPPRTKVLYTPLVEV